MNIHPKTKYAYDLFHAGTLALSRAEQQGIRIDTEYCEKKKAHLTRKINRMEGIFKNTNFYRHWEHSMGKVNINSNSQLSVYLYKIKKLKPAYTTTSGQGSTDEEALLQLNIPELNDLLQIRKLKKVRDTYLDAFVREQVNGYIHPSFNLHLVKTFRSSSDRPNFQNIPKRDKEAMQITRKALFPRPGHQLMEVDFSGIEVRIAVSYHKDPQMIKYITDPTTDMHGDMAKEIFIIDNFDKSIPEYKVLRQAAKNGFVFPQFYGDYYKNCARNMACNWGKLPEGKWKSGQGIDLPDGKLSDHFISKKIKSFDDFSEHVKEIEKHFWNVRFNVYRKWKEQWWRDYQKTGYIDMHTGFRCYGIMSRNDVTNYPVQGAAFHCLLWSLVTLDKRIRENNWDTRIIGQIHDSIVLDVNPNELEDIAKMVKKVTCTDLPIHWNWINVPLEIEADICEVDASWAELKPFDFPK
jgi:DNA polymerase-1